MNSKAKAKELVKKMSQHSEEWGWQEIAKEQAKICVDEILKSKSTNYTIEVLEDIKYWKDVLTEIDNL